MAMAARSLRGAEEEIPMQPFTREDLQSLLTEQRQPCVSISLATRRAPSEWQQNALKFKNALREAERVLAQKKEWKAAAPEILKKLASLDDPDFWAKQRDTL